MRLRIVALTAAMAMLAGCGPEPNSAAPEPAQAAAGVKPADESRRFPLANRVDTQVIENHLLDKSFMPGGTLANYQRGKTRYSMFAGKMPSPQEAAFLLADWSKAMTGAQIIPSFGGYFGQDAGRPVFVFAKGAWIAGVAGLAEKDADAAARVLAAHLN